MKTYFHALLFVFLGLSLVSCEENSSNQNMTQDHTVSGDQNVEAGEKGEKAEDCDDEEKEIDVEKIDLAAPADAGCKVE